MRSRLRLFLPVLASIGAFLPLAEAGSEGVSCKLKAEEIAARRQKLIPGLFDRAAQATDLADGIRFRFDPAPSLLRDLTKVIEREQDCCSFLKFTLTAAPGAGPVILDVTGPAGTAEMLRGLGSSKEGTRP